MLSRWSYVAQDCDHHALRTDIVVRSQAMRPDLLADVLGLFVCCTYGHYDDHLAVLHVGAPAGSRLGNKKAEAMPLLAPGTTRDPGLGSGTVMRVAVKKKMWSNVSAATLSGPGAGVNSRPRDSAAGAAPRVGANRLIDRSATVWNLGEC